jgi:hypothetical protein
MHRNLAYSIGSGTEIKGHMRPYNELLEASGYARRSKDFDDLIRNVSLTAALLKPFALIAAKVSPATRDPAHCSTRTASSHSG